MTGGAARLLVTEKRESRLISYAQNYQAYRGDNLYRKIFTLDTEYGHGWRHLQLR